MLQSSQINCRMLLRIFNRNATRKPFTALQIHRNSSNASNTFNELVNLAKPETKYKEREDKYEREYKNERGYKKHKPQRIPVTSNDIPRITSPVKQYLRSNDSKNTSNKSASQQKSRKPSSKNHENKYTPDTSENYNTLDELVNIQTPGKNSYRNRDNKFPQNTWKNYSTPNAQENYRKTTRLVKPGAHERKIYQPTGELIYGIYPVQLALDAQRRSFYQLMYKEGVEQRNERVREIIETAESYGVKTSGISSAEFRKVLSGDQVHQGVCCDVSPLPFEILTDTYKFSSVEDELQLEGIREHSEMVEKDIGLRNNCKEEIDSSLKTENIEIGEEKIDYKINDEEKLTAESVPIEENKEQNRSQKLNKNEEKVNENKEKDKLSASYKFVENKEEIRSQNLKSYAVENQSSLESERKKLLETDNTENLKESIINEGKRPELWVYLDQIQDPMNFGSILRSAYFFGVDKVLTSGRNSCGLSGVVSKASAGIAEVLPVYTLPYPPIQYFNRLATQGWILAATAHQSGTDASLADLNRPLTPVHQFNPKANTLLILGNEGSGVQDDIIKLCNVVLTIQSASSIHPAANCLNVSAATAILLHTLTTNLRQS